jgi:hypothetical protein
MLLKLLTTSDAIPIVSCEIISYKTKLQNGDVLTSEQQ